MPPKFRFTKDEIVEEALNIVRKEGASALTVRALSAKLNSSTKILFGYFSGIEELKRAVGERSYSLYLDFIKREIESKKFPDYKASGMAYIRFAKEEKELFKFMFMRDRREEERDENSEQELLHYSKILSQKFDLSEESARKFHLEMWVYVHGIATMVATDYLDWEWDFISETLSDVYMGIRKRFIGE